MRLMKSILAGLSISAALFFSSCKSDSGVPSGSAVKFSAASATYAEDIGTENIVVSLTIAQKSDITIQYSWTSTDTTTYLGGDFTFGTPKALQVIIPAGQTTANIPVNIIDDAQVDGDDNITIQLVSATNGVPVSSTGNENTFDLTINDNDVSPADNLQMDLTWYLEDDAFADINAVDMNLYLQKGVQYNATDGIQDIGKTVTASINTTGFETIFLKNTDIDTVYWIAAEYHAGTVGVNFIITLNGFQSAFVNNYGSGNFPAGTEAQYGSFFGPWTKDAESFTEGRLAMKPALPNGKIYQFKVKNFHPN